MYNDLRALRGDHASLLTKCVQLVSEWVGGWVGGTSHILWRLAGLASGNGLLQLALMFQLF
jgi:hypothetical protein